MLELTVRGTVEWSFGNSYKIIVWKDDRKFTVWCEMKGDACLKYGTESKICGELVDTRDFDTIELANCEVVNE